MKRLLPGLACLLAFIQLGAQSPSGFDFDNFTPLRSKGPLPAMIAMSGQDFMSESRKNVSEGGNRTEKKAKEKFVLETSYMMKELFVSGRILYNDPISDYVEQVRLKITANHSELAAGTKVFVIKSAVVNAFATNQGYIFVTTGLLARLESEAQLAFILCHELIHYQKKHVINSYVENSKIDNGIGAYRKASIDKKYLAKTNYSRENETEADLLGFDLYLTTGYSLNEIDKVFDVLKFSEQPFADNEFKPTLLESEYLKIPDYYLFDEVYERIGENEDADDAYSTHPNLSTRRSDIKNKIGEIADSLLKDSSRVVFQLPKADFLMVRKIARFDLCHSDLLNRDYDLALYDSYCLLQEEPNSTYLKKILLKALYGLTRYANSNRSREVSHGYKRVQGNIQRVNYMLDKLDKKELNAIALNYAWRLKTSLKKDVEVNRITNEIFYDLVKKHFPQSSSFATELIVEVPDTARTDDKKMLDMLMATKSTDAPGDKETLSEKKLTRGNKTALERRLTDTNFKKKPKKVNKNPDFIEYAFIDLFKDSVFTHTYDSLAKHVKGDKNNGNDSWSFSSKGRNKSVFSSDINMPDDWVLDTDKDDNYKYNASTNSYALGIDSIIVLNPYYYRIDERKRVSNLYESSESAQRKFDNKLRQLAARIDLAVDVIDKKQLDAKDVTRYNDMAVLVDWFEERLDHRRLNMVPTDYANVDSIIKKHGTKYLAIIGSVNYIAPKMRKRYLVNAAASVILPVISWPFTFKYLFKKSTETYVYVTVYNMETGKVEMNKTGRAPTPDRSDIVNAMLYDYLLQIKRAGYTNNK